MRAYIPAPPRGAPGKFLKRAEWETLSATLTNCHRLFFACNYAADHKFREARSLRVALFLRPSNLNAHAAKLQNRGRCLRNGSSLAWVKRTVKGPEAPSDGDSDRSIGNR